jgi:hypothetical protein
VQIAVTIDPAACVALLAEAVNTPDIPAAVRALVRQAAAPRR